MTIARDQTATGTAGSSTTFTLTWATAPAAGSKCLVLIQTPSSGAVSSVKDNGTVQSTFTQDFLYNGGGGDLMVYRADGISLPGTGSYTVTVTMSGTQTVVAGGRTYTGVATGAPSTSNHNTGTSNSVTTGNVTPTVTGSLLVGGFADDSGANPETITLTTSGGQDIYKNTNGSILAAASADNIASTTSAQGLAWTLGDSPDFGAYVALYAPAAGTNVTGTLATVLPPPTDALTGAEVISGTIATALPPPTDALTGAEQMRGTLATALPPPTDALTGAEVISGTIATALPPPTDQLNGATGGTVTGTLATVLPPPVDALTGSAGAANVTGTLATVLPPPVDALTGAEVISGTIATALPPPADALTGTALLAVTGTLATVLPPRPPRSPGRSSRT